MYLWKYWRESRTVSSIAILCIAAFVLLIFKGRIEAPKDPRQIAQVTAVLLYLQLLPIGLLAWLMGGYGVGRDLGDGSGSYLLTRPRPRRWFTWRDWGFGLAHVAAAIVLMNLLAGYMLHRLASASGGLWSGAIPFRDMAAPVKITTLMGLNSLTLLLLGGLVFGLTYCSTIAVKHARGLMLGAGILIGYAILRGVFEIYAPAVALPSLMLREFQLSTGSGPVALANSLGLEAAIRAVVVMLFPFAAQVILERSEI
jgi:hypothetical protein